MSPLLLTIKNNPRIGKVPQGDFWYLYEIINSLQQNAQKLKYGSLDNNNQSISNDNGKNHSIAR